MLASKPPFQSSMPFSVAQSCMLLLRGYSSGVIHRLVIPILGNIESGYQILTVTVCFPGRLSLWFQVPTNKIRVKRYQAK